MNSFVKSALLIIASLASTLLIIIALDFSKPSNVSDYSSFLTILFPGIFIILLVIFFFLFFKIKVSEKYLYVVSGALVMIYLIIVVLFYILSVLGL